MDININNMTRPLHVLLSLIMKQVRVKGDGEMGLGVKDMNEDDEKILIR